MVKIIFRNCDADGKEVIKELSMRIPRSSEEVFALDKIGLEYIQRNSDSSCLELIMGKKPCSEANKP